MAKEPENTTPHPLLSQFKELALTQLSVNNTMAGDNWLEEAREGTRINYMWAAMDEAAELWRCAIPFKFWDKSEFNMDAENAKMEVVDLLHFGLAQSLVNVYADGVKEPQALGGKVAAQMVSSLTDSVSDDPQSALREHLRGFINGLTAEKSIQIRWKHFFGMADAVGLSPEALISLYKGKAVLNKFRTQMKANGKYSKIWLDQKEDNYYLTNWLSTQPSQPSESETMNWLISTHRRMFPNI
jgi:dimeric dUTPase (all-alpha-NTP-PPase superfamily)